jgi:hypothetical protein
MLNDYWWFVTCIDCIKLVSGEGVTINIGFCFDIKKDYWCFETVS